MSEPIMRGNWPISSPARLGRGRWATAWLTSRATTSGGAREVTSIE